MSTATELLAQLARGGHTLGVAESLTGGLLADAFVQVPGASAVFRGGIVAYATDMKTALLGVDEALLAAQGPVDGQVALAMAWGAARQLRADVGLATTGVAGPEPTRQPVGTVFVAAVWANKQWVVRHAFAGGRQAIRSQAVLAAIAALATICREQVAGSVR